jgi:hypothetical protein
MRNFKDFFNSDSASDHSKRNLEMMNQIAESGNKAMKEIFDVSSNFIKDRNAQNSEHLKEINKPDKMAHKVKKVNDYSKEVAVDNFKYIAKVAKVATAGVMSSLENALKHMQNIYGDHGNEFEETTSKKTKK